jgi:hypothetical protein
MCGPTRVRANLLRRPKINQVKLLRPYPKGPGSDLSSWPFCILQYLD